MKVLKSRNSAQFSFSRVKSSFYYYAQVYFYSRWIDIVKISLDTHFINEIFMSTAILIDEYYNSSELKILTKHELM
jgi:hypothetical protein